MVDRSFNNEAIAAHNHFRAGHGCPNLKFDSNLAKSAQTWANQLARNNRLQHSQAREYGENLAYKWASANPSLSGQEATQMWYDEIQFHNFKGEFQSKSGHFTQLIWKSSAKAGFGRAKSADGKSIYVVGQYTPAGNVRGQFATNVPPAKKPVKPIVGKPEIKVKKTRKHKCTIL